MPATKHELLSTELDGFPRLAQLPRDLRSTGNHATDKIWCTLDAELWVITQHPEAVRQAASRTNRAETFQT